MTVFGEGFIKVRPDTAGFGEETKSKADSALKSVAKLATATLAIGGVGDFFKNSIDNALKFQEQTAGLDQTLKNIGQGTEKAKKQADDYAEALSKASGFARNDVVTSLQRATQGTKNLGDAEKVETTAANLARARHIDLGAATLLVTKAFAGNTSSLKRMGISFTPVSAAQDALKTKIAAAQKVTDAATGSTKKADQANVKALKGQLDAAKAADLIGTKAKVQKTLIDLTAGGMKAFGETTAGKMAKAENAIDELETKIGLGLLPIIGDLADKGSAYIERLDKEWPKIAATIEGVVHRIESAVDDVAAHVGGIQNLENAAKIFAATLLVLAASVKVVTIATGLFNIVLDANPVVLLAFAIAGLAAGLYLLYQRSTTARAIMQQIAQTVNTDVKSALQWLSQTGVPSVTKEFDKLAPRVEGDIRQIVSVIESFVSQVRQNWGTITSILGPIVQLAFNVVKTVFTTELHEIEKTIDLFGNVLHGRWGAAWDDLKDIVETAIKAAVTIVVDTLTALQDTVNALGEAVGHQIGRGIKAGISDLEGLAGQLGGKIKSAIGEVASDAVGEAEKIGSNIIRGIGQGIRDGAGHLADVAKGVAKKALSTATFGALDYHGIGNTIIQGIVGSSKALGPALTASLTAQVTASITSAKQNLSNLSGGLATSIGQVIDASTAIAVAAIPAKLTAAIAGVAAGTQLSDAAAKISKDAADKQQRSLQTALATATSAAQAGPDLTQLVNGKPITPAQVAAQQADLNQAVTDAQTDLDDFLLQAQINLDQAKHDSDVATTQDAATQAKQRVSDQIAQWTTQFNQGLLSQQAFIADINGLDSQYASAGDALGYAFQQAFAAQISSILAQVQAIVAAGQTVGGSGLGGNITAPSDVLVSQAITTKGALGTDTTNIAQAKAAIKAANSTYDSNVVRDKADAKKLAQDSITYQASLKAANAQLAAAESQQKTDKATLAALEQLLRNAGVDPAAAIAAAGR